jgi:hypothetical protein
VGNAVHRRTSVSVRQKAIHDPHCLDQGGSDPPAERSHPGTS